MKVFNMKKMKAILLSGAMALLAATSLTLGFSLMNPVNANAATLSSTAYQTDGASVRVLTKNDEGEYEEATKQGIRFHVEMGAGYTVNDTVLLDTATTNDNGSYKVADGYKTYTLAIPTRLLNGDLTVDTAKVRKIDTTKYWFTDADGNWESVAYIHSFPAEYFTDPLSFRGIICKVDGETETVVASTATSERSLTWVAKRAYSDTIDENSDYWGTAENDTKAAPIIKKFIPTYNITYDVNGVQTTEEVLWGETPKNVPTVDPIKDDHLVYTSAWYDAANNTEVDINSELSFNESCDITFTHVSSMSFNLTGVVNYDNFNVGSAVYSGVKIYATLPVGDFYTAAEIQSGTDRMVELATDAVNVEYVGSGSFNGLQGVWAVMEGVGSGAQLRLMFAFDSSTMKTGDKLILRADSVFYAQNIMYTLAEEYTINYKVNAQSQEDYNIFLGYLYNSDIAKIESWIEPTDASRKRIRITFYEDLLINSSVALIYDGALPTGYAYPMYTHCHATGEKTQISQGYYYWNEGEHAILELEGYADQHSDELFGVPGMKIVQNGGYFIFQDAIYAYYNGAEWVVGEEKGSFGANAFEWEGWDATDTTEIRFTTNGNTALTAGGTTNRWFDKVVAMTAEKMDDNAPYAVWFTDVDGTQKEIKDFMYHGQATASSYNHIFAFKDFKGTQAGQMVTIANGTRLWVGNEYYTATEEINFYYNGKAWIANHNAEVDNTTSIDIYEGHGYNFYEVGINKIRLHFTTEPFVNAQGTKELYVESGSVNVNGTVYALKYYGLIGDTNHKILELVGGTQNAIGQNAFADKLVIEAGTRLWVDNYCVEFTDEWTLTYIGEALKDGGGNLLKKEWVTSENTNISAADIVRLYNATDAGGEVRLVLKDGILTDSLYGFMAVDATKGLPVVNGVEFADQSFTYGMGNDLIAVRGGQYGQKPGDYIVIPKGSVWWTTQGSLTFTDEIFYTYINNAWVQGDSRATVNVTANNATVTGLDNLIVDIPYPFTVTPEEGYTVSSVTVNGIEMTITENNQYIFYAEKTNTIVVETLQGYSVNFYISEGVTVDGGAITNGMVKAVASGQTLTFTVAVADGYRINTVNGATDNDNGTYTVSAAGTVTITAVKQWTVSYDIPANVTASLGGVPVSGAGSLTVDAGTYSAVISANAGYILKSVTANGIALSASNNTYSITLNGDIELAAEVIDPINVSNATLSRTIYYQETNPNSGEIYRGLRIHFNSENEELAEIIGGNYGIVMTGNVSLTINGAAATPGQYSYFGLIDNTQHQALEVRFDTTQWKNGDKFVIEAGTYFSFVDKAGKQVYIYFDETISVENYSVTWNAPTGATITVMANAEYLQNGEKMGGDVSLKTNAMVLKGTTLTITVEPETYYEVKDITVNGTSIGVPSGTYQVSGETTISATTAKLSYAVTWTDPANATISVTANGAAISNGAMVEAGTTLTVTVEPTAIKYAVSSVKINGEDKGTSGVYSYSVTSAVTIEAAVAEKSADEKEAEILNTIKGDVAKYTGSTLTVDANGNLVSNGAQTSIQFTNDFFTLLNEYGYESIKFDMSKTSGQTNNNYYYQTSAGNTAFISAARGAKTQTKSNVSISSAVTYKAQYKTRSNGTLRDDSSTWTLSNISFS